MSIVKNRIPHKRYSESHKKALDIITMHNVHLLRAINKHKRNKDMSRIYDALIIEAHRRGLINE